VLSLDFYDPINLVSWVFSDVEILKTDTGFKGFFEHNVSGATSYSTVAFDTTGARDGNFVTLVGSGIYSAANEKIQVLALPSGNFARIFDDTTAIATVIFDPAGNAIDGKSLAGGELNIPALFETQSLHSALTQKNELVTCHATNSNLPTSILRLLITPLLPGDLLGTEVTVDIYDNGTASNNGNLPLQKECIVHALAGGGVVVLHSGVAEDRASKQVTFYNENFEVTANAQVADDSVLEGAAIACNANDTCLIVFSLTATRNQYYYTSNSAGTKTLGPFALETFSAANYAATAFEDGTFAFIVADKDSTTMTMWNINSEGVLENKQSLPLIKPSSKGRATLIATGLYSAKLFYEVAEFVEYYAIDVHKNQLTVAEADGSFTVTNQSAHTVDTSITLVGVAPAT
jgi:hypothetical protein